jgi:diphosphomevalonate decarboxylase
VQNYHETFRNLRDRILIVESGQKRISSSVGHSLMKDHPFAIKRFDQARDNLKLLQRAFIEGNWKSFISVVEEEALSLHAMMLTSKPGFILMQPGTLSIMHKIRDYREQTGQRLCFTLDAGANVHLLHAEADEGPVEDFVKSELIPFCENGRFISDKMGPGPVKAEGT